MNYAKQSNVKYVACDRCKRQFPVDHAEKCWYCMRDLCYECWDKYGHCGHPEADEINKAVKKHHES